MRRWVDDHGHVVGDTHEPEAGAVAAGRGGAAGKTRGGGGSEGSAANGGGKRQKRSTMDLLGGGGGGGTGSSASDLQSLPSGGAAEAAAPLQGTAAALGASLAAGHASAVDDAVPMDGVSAEPAAAGLPLGSPGQQFGGAAAAPGGLLSAQGASPGKVLDTYTHFNLAAQQPGAAGLGSAAAWLPPPVVAPPPNLDIQGLRVSLLPPPAQVRQAVRRTPAGLLSLCADCLPPASSRFRWGARHATAPLWPNCRPPSCQRRYRWIRPARWRRPVWRRTPLTTSATWMA